jgi:hypothetical protein
MGSKRNMVSDNMVYLCNTITCKDDERLGRKENCLSFHNRISGSYVYIFWRESFAGFAQLWTGIIIAVNSNSLPQTRCYLFIILPKILFS